jgi:hypothetical protein
MDLADWYAVALGGLAALTVAAQFTLSMSKLKWVGYRQFHQFLTGTSTQIRSLLFFLLFGAVTHCTCCQHLYADPRRGSSSKNVRDIVKGAIFDAGHDEMVTVKFHQPMRNSKGLQKPARN